MTRLSNYYRALLLFLITTFYSGSAWSQCTVTVNSSKMRDCIDFSVTFGSTNTSGKTANTYDWDFGDGTTDNSSGGTVTHIYKKAGKYKAKLKITFTDGTTCEATGQEVEAFDKPKVNFDLPAGGKIIQCFQNNGVKNSFCFQNKSTPGTSGAPLIKYDWNFGDGQNSSDKDPCHTYEAEGTYIVTLTVEDSNHCKNTYAAPVNMVVLKDIQANFNVTGKAGCNQSTYTFRNVTDTLGIGGVKSFKWEFGDPSNSTNTTDWEPTFTYTTPGKFKVKLTIVNGLGCTNTYIQEATNIEVKLKVKYIDSICFTANNVQFQAEPIAGATYWQWTFDDPPSGQQNIAPFEWAPSHEFQDGPRNYQVRFRVVHPCGNFDTCIVVHLKGPQAAVLLPKPPFPSNDYFPAKPMPKSEFQAVKNGNLCDKRNIKYSFFTPAPDKVDTIYGYCNATVTQKIIDTLEYCDGDTQIFVKALVMNPTSMKVVTRKDSTENTTTWFWQTDPIPSVKTYYPSSGTLTWETMHDSNLFTCKLPNLVRFTNQSVKYRLYQALDNDPKKYVGGKGWNDTCKNPTYPFASDSMDYLWQFNDPNGKQCTSTVSNKDWDCNYSTLAAPYHYYKGPETPATRCAFPQLRVIDQMTKCTSQTTQQLKQGPPNAWWDRSARGYCKMNFQMQRVLPQGGTGPTEPPMRGLVMFPRQPVECAGSAYPYEIRFNETLPTCGAQNWWAVWDSAQARSVKCIQTKLVNGKQVNDTVWDYGFLGANNKSGYPVGGPKSTWTSLPWLGNYWYAAGDDGCKTIGIVLKNDNCYDTAWYHDYFCFNKITAYMTVLNTDSAKNIRALVGDSKTSSFGKICHMPNNKDTIGVRLQLIPRDLDMKEVLHFEYNISRLELPAGDYYYTKKPNGFWPDTAVLDVFVDDRDSITSIKDTMIVPMDSMTIVDLFDNLGNKLGVATLNNFPFSPTEWDALKAQGKVNVPLTDFRARMVSFYCRDNFVTVKVDQDYLNRTGQSLGVKNFFTTINLQDNFRVDSKMIKGTNIPMHDTVTFKLPYPGVYFLTSGAYNLQGCAAVSQYPLVYGHYAQFNVKGGDSVVCVGDVVEFEYKVGYWSTICPPLPNGPPPVACLDVPIYPNPDDFDFAPYNDGTGTPFNPWNVKDPETYRKSMFPLWGRHQTFRKETIAWNFGDNSAYYQPILQSGSDKVQYSWSKPGVYTVDMRTSDSLGCTIHTRRTKFIKVIGVKADFKLVRDRDSLLVCAPKQLAYQDMSQILGSEGKDPYKFQVKEKVVKKGKLVDTLITVDSITTWRWVSGDGDVFTRVKSDTQQIYYDSNGYFTPQLRVTTAGKCLDDDVKANYIHVVGPRPRFELLDTSGCMPLTVRVRNLNLTGYAYRWDLGDNDVVTSKRTDEIVLLKYDNDTGSFDIVLTELDSVYNPYTSKYEQCSFTYPTPNSDSPKFTVHVWPNSQLEVTGDTAICPRGTANFQARSKYNEYKTFTWDFGDGTVETGAFANRSHTFKYAGQNLYYWVKVRGESIHGCSSFDSMRIWVDSLTADFTVDSSKSNALLGKFTFTNLTKSLPKEASSYEWNFGDGSPSVTTTSKEDVSHDYDKTIPKGTPEEDKDDVYTFDVKLKAVSPNGCVDTITKKIMFSRKWKHYNVFTPNDDKINDEFNPLAKGVMEYKIEIFNRWGERVFVSYDEKNDWNGKVNNTGGSCVDGTYYYVWTFKLVGGVEQTVIGTVSIVR